MRQLKTRFCYGAVHSVLILQISECHTFATQEAIPIYTTVIKV